MFLIMHLLPQGQQNKQRYSRALHMIGILMWSCVYRQWPHLADKSKATAILSCRRRARWNNCVWLKSSSHIYRTSARQNQHFLPKYPLLLFWKYILPWSSICHNIPLSMVVVQTSLSKTLLLYSNAGIKCKWPVCYFGRSCLSQIKDKLTCTIRYTQITFRLSNFHWHSAHTIETSPPSKLACSMEFDFATYSMATLRFLSPKAW